MAQISKDGKLVDSRVTIRMFPDLEHGAMSAVNGMVVHQTGGSTAESTLSSYKTSNYGAHFLIDKDGTIYQTASMLKSTWHVGPIRARCLVELRCTPAEIKSYANARPMSMHRAEMKKSVPNRYPSNADSIGIELVGEFDEKVQSYVAVTAEQNKSLGWLVNEISRELKVPIGEVFRHPQLSRKKDSEASSARWSPMLE